MRFHRLCLGWRGGGVVGAEQEKRRGGRGTGSGKRQGGHKTEESDRDCESLPLPPVERKGGAGEEGGGAAGPASLIFSSPASLLMHLRTFSSCPQEDFVLSNGVMALFPLCSELCNPVSPSQRQKDSPLISPDKSRQPPSDWVRYHD